MRGVGCRQPSVRRTSAASACHSVRALTTVYPDRVVDGEDRCVGEGVVGSDTSNVGPLVANALEHRRLHPLRQPPPAVRRIDARVLLEGDAWVIGIERHLGASDTGTCGIAYECRPAASTALDERTVEFGDEVGVDEPVADVEVLTWCRLHDVVEGCDVVAQVLRDRAIDQLECVAELTGLFGCCPPVHGCPVDARECELARPVNASHPGAEALGEGLCGGYSIEGRPRQQCAPVAQGLVADESHQSSADSLPAPITAHEHIALHEPFVTCGGRPAVADSDRGAVDRLDEPCVVAEL